MVERTPTRRFYSINQASVATLLGGPIGGAFLLSQNYKQFKAPRHALIAIVVGILATLALIPIALILPESVPNAVLPIGYTIGFRGMARQLQGSELQSVMDSGAGAHSWWRVIGLSVVALCATAVLMLGAFYFVIPGE